MKANFYLIFLGGTVLLLVTVWFGSRVQKKIGTENYKVFNKSNINGVIKYVGIRNHGSSFQLIGDSIIYVFYPNGYSGANVNHPFHNFAKPGDKVIKGAYRDSLVLIKDDSAYVYFFLKEFN